MVAQYTVKIGDKWYKAGDTLPDVDSNKAVSIPKKIEPPFEVEEEKQAEPQKRRYTRRK